MVLRDECPGDVPQYATRRLVLHHVVSSSAMDVDIDEPRHDNQIGKVEALSAHRRLQAAPRAQVMDTAIFDHDYRILNSFRWSKQPGGSNAGLHREFVIVKNRAG